MCKTFNNILFLAGLLAAPLTSLAYTLNVNINTTSLAGTSATLAFDFINGDGLTNNTAQVGSFLTDGVFNTALASSQNDVTGLLNTSVSFGDSQFFNELLQPITFGNSLQFQLQATNIFNPGSLTPDSFSFFILDNLTSLPLFATTDSTSSDALFALDLTGATDGLSVFNATAGSPAWSVQAAGNTSVPEPGVFLLILAGLSSAYLRRSRYLV